MTKRILLAGGESANRSATRLVLQQAGWEVMTCADGREALELAQVDPPDLILLDAHSPGVDGYEVCHRLKAGERTRNVVVVLREAVAADGESQWEADDYIERSVDGRQLVIRLRNLLRLKEARDKLQSHDRELEALFNASADRVYVLDANRMVLRANQKAIEFLGFPLDEVVGRRCHEVFFGKPDLCEDCLLTHVFETGQPARDTKRRISSDGTEMWLDVSAYPIFDEGEQPTRVVEYVRDVTEGKRAEMELQRLYEAEQRRANEMAALHHAANAITATLDPAEVLSNVLKVARDAFGVDVVSVMLYDEANDCLVCAASSDVPNAMLGQRLRLGEGIAGWVFRHDKLVRVDDVTSDPRWYRGFDWVTGYRTQSLMAAPLRVRGRVIGVIEVINKVGDRFDDRDPALLESLALTAAVAIENARLVEQLVKSERMVAIGQIGLAMRHEINNPLTSVLGNVQLLLRDPSLPDNVRRKLETVQEQSLRIRDIVNKLEHVEDRTTTYLGDTQMIDLGGTLAK